MTGPDKSPPAGVGSKEFSSDGRENLFSNHVQPSLQSVVHFYLAFLRQDLNPASAEGGEMTISRRGGGYLPVGSQPVVSVQLDLAVLVDFSLVVRHGLDRQNLVRVDTDCLLPRV